MFDAYLSRWDLIPDGEPIVTHSSRLLPVRRRGGDGAPAILKVAVGPEEKFGGGLMVWWDGQGAARVLEHDGGTLLLERAEGARSLADMARSGHDDEATRVLCWAVARMHAPRDKTLPHAVPLTQWFRELEPAAVHHGGILTRCAATARELLASLRDEVALHGDMHHGNVLDFGAERGWLAIDPKRLYGERGFDYANLFCNPDHETATAPGRLARRADIVAEEAGLDRTRLLQWVLAYSGLSAAWTLGDGDTPDIALAVAGAAAGELDRA